MELTTEQKIERLWDEGQIRKLMASYVYYGYGRVWERVPGLFANRDDIWVDVEGFGIFDGPKGIETFFVKWHHSMEGDAKGIISIHSLSTEMIEVAKDGQTARAIWISPGVETRRLADGGELDAYWLWGFYAIDFIKDNGEWKFWHFRIPHILLCDYHHSWTEVDNSTKGNEIDNSGRPTADRPTTFDGTFYGKEKFSHMFFDPPKPFDTYDDIKDKWTK